jgi:hypothetical protein
VKVGAGLCIEGFYLGAIDDSFAKIRAMEEDLLVPIANTRHVYVARTLVRSSRPVWVRLKFVEIEGVRLTPAGKKSVNGGELQEYAATRTGTTFGYTFAAGPPPHGVRGYIRRRGRRLPRRWS